MKLDFHYDEIVIGGGLNAFSYSYKNDVPLLINKMRAPHRFEPQEEELWNKLYLTISRSTAFQHLLKSVINMQCWIG